MTAAKVVMIQSRSSLDCLTGKHAATIWQTSPAGFDVNLWCFWSNGESYPLKSAHTETAAGALNAARQMCQREHAHLERMT